MPRKKTGNGNNMNPSRKNLVSLADRTIEERREIGRKGGIACGEKRRLNRTLREIAQEMLNETATKADIERLGLPEDATKGAAILASMMKSAVENENVKAAEYVRDTSGQAPTKEVKVSADVMTDADRSLVDKVKRRLEKDASTQ